MSTWHNYISTLTQDPHPFTPEQVETMKSIYNDMPEGLLRYPTIAEGEEGSLEMSWLNTSSGHNYAVQICPTKKFVGIVMVAHTGEYSSQSSPMEFLHAVKVKEKENL